MILQVAFFLPQLVQQLRGDDSGAVRQFLFEGAKRSRLFAHHLVSSLLNSVIFTQACFLLGFQAQHARAMSCMHASRAGRPQAVWCKGEDICCIL